MCPLIFIFFFFFFNDTATTEIYTLSLHDALPISVRPRRRIARPRAQFPRECAQPQPLSTLRGGSRSKASLRSEEHTSELQSHSDLVCRLLLEKKKTERELVPHVTDHIVESCSALR